MSNSYSIVFGAAIAMIAGDPILAMFGVPIFAAVDLGPAGLCGVIVAIGGIYKVHLEAKKDQKYKESLEAANAELAKEVAEIKKSVATRGIIDSSDDAIISKDLEGVVTSWNLGAQRLFGYSPLEMIGQLIYRIVPVDRIAEEKTILDLIKAGKRVENFEAIRVHKDGSPVRVSITISPIHNARGQVIGASKIARKLSDRLPDASCVPV